MKKIILICILMIIVTIGAVSASDNASANELTADNEEIPITQTIGNENTLNSDNNPENPIQIDENEISVKSAEKLNVSYSIIVDEEQLEKSGFDSDFNIEMYDREYLNGNLEIYIDDNLKFKTNPAVDYNYHSHESWESSQYPNSYSILDIDFLYRLDLTYGLHKAEFKYSGDSLFNDFDEIRYFNYTYIRFYVPEGESEYDPDICVMSYSAFGNLKIVVDNMTLYDDEFDGYAYIELENLTIGTHNYDIYYTGDYFKPIHKQGTFKKSYEFWTYQSDDEMRIDETELIISLPDDAKSNVTVNVNNKTYSIAVKDGEARLKMTKLNLGKNSLSITYKDDKYYERTITTDITILPAFHFTYSDSGEYQNDANVELVMSEDAQGNLKIKIDDEYLTSELINGTASIPLNMIGPGTHDFEITYTGDYEEYFQNKTYKNIEISQGNPYKDWDMEYSIYTDDDEKDYLYIELPDGENGTATITVNNATKNIVIENESCILYPLDLPEGIWDIEVTYSGNKINKTKTFKVDTTTKHFSLDIENYYYRDSVKAAYIYYDYDDKYFFNHASVSIDNKRFKEITDYGEIDLSKLSPGTHTIVVQFRNDENAVIQTVTEKFTIFGYSSYPKIEFKDTASYELNNYFDRYSNWILLSNDTTLIMDLDLNYNINGNVTAYRTNFEFYGTYNDQINESIFDEYKCFNLNNGKARIVIPTKIFNNTYSLKLVIKLNDGNTINCSFKTYWYPKVVHPAKMTYGENQTLTIYIPGLDNKVIGMFGNFKPVYSKIINGTAKFSLSTLPIRNGVPVTFIYSQEEYDDELGYYSTIYETYNLKLNIIDTFQKIDMYYNDGTSYSLKVAKIYGDTVKKGQTVKFKIGTYTFNVKTDKNGVAKLKIPSKIKPGQYTLTATYKNAKISKKLTVKHIVNLKAVKVKKSAKKLVLTATLKNKKVIKNKKVTFKFNGKTYKAKTNSKGIAKVTIKSQVLKKLKVGKKITYQATYLKDTVKKTVKVLK